MQLMIWKDVHQGLTFVLQVLLTDFPVNCKVTGNVTHLRLVASRLTSATSQAIHVQGWWELRAVIS